MASEEVTTYGKLVVGQTVLDVTGRDDGGDRWLTVTEIIAAAMDTPIDHDVVFYAEELLDGEKREHRVRASAHATCLVMASE